jgi:predicted deacylase
MTAIIAFLIALGIITNAQEATPEIIQEYEQEYQQEWVVIEDSYEF